MIGESDTKAKGEVGTKVLGTSVGILSLTVVGLTVMLYRGSVPTAPAAQPVVSAAQEIVFPCNVQCIKNEALRQGADVLTSLDNLKFSMDVRYSAAADQGEACGEQHTYPAFEGLVLNPKAQLKLTTMDTRERPSITFECTAGKSYHLVLNDALGGAFQNQAAYTHWAKLNIDCPTGQTRAKVEDSGEDITQGTTVTPNWYDTGKGYLPPAFPYNAFHHFNFYIFETAAPFDATRVAKFNTDLPANNQLGGGAWTIADIMADLELAAPVARTWMDVTTSYWSKVRMTRIEDRVADLDFYKLICPCNLAENWPGLNVAGMEACNL